MGQYFRLISAGCLFLLLFTETANGQGTTRPRVRNSNVGYIDTAVPGSNLRLRLDSVFNNVAPTRSEFFWAPGPPNGRGPAFPERSVDYQDYSATVEHLLFPATSVFIGVPVRALDPERNSNTVGFSDVNLGLKHAFIFRDDLVASFQLRAYAPTGDVHRGLGTGHANLEPGLLIFKPLGSGWVAEAELRDWIPLEKSEFSGNVLRYGFGVHYDGIGSDAFRVVPVAELVGWTALGGRVAVVPESGVPAVRDAIGDTIVNVKLGTRFKFGDRTDLFAGYGRPLTGDTWYDDTVRLELRWMY